MSTTILERRQLGRGICARMVLAFWALVACAASARAAVEVRDEHLLDHVWAGHPVGFAFVAHHGYLFAAYYDAERRITVASRAPGAREWTKVKPEGVWNERHKRMSNVVDWDSHNALVLAIDRDGIVHLSGNLHVDPLVYYRSTRALDIASLERLDRMTGDREGACTYPVFFKNQAGDFFFRYRDGSSGKGSDIYNVYDYATRTWRHLLDTPLHEGEGKRNAYATDPILGPDGRFHVLWMWRHTPDAATNHCLSYVRSADLLHWEDAQGRPVPLPITFGKGDIVDPAAAGEGLINTTYALGFDREHRPIPIYHRYDENGHSQIFAARRTANGWQRKALTDWSFRWAFGGGGSIVTDVYVTRPRSAADGSLLVPFTSRITGDGVLRFDPQTLVKLEVLPPDPPPLPPALMRVSSEYPEMQVRTKVAGEGEHRFVLRWETLPTNRDQPRAEAPPPSELRVYEVSGDIGESRPADR
jgi:hypothetical protein